MNPGAKIWLEIRVAGENAALAHPCARGEPPPGMAEMQILQEQKSVYTPVGKKIALGERATINTNGGIKVLLCSCLL